MTDKIFITGDRANSEVYAGLVAIELIRQASAGARIATGDCEFGVEALTRALLREAGVAYEKFPNPVGADGKPAWDERHADLRDNGWSVVAIHADPHASSVVRSALKVLGDDELRIVTPINF